MNEIKHYKAKEHWWNQKRVGPYSKNFEYPHCCCLIDITENM